MPEQVLQLRGNAPKVTGGGPTNNQALTQGRSRAVSRCPALQLLPLLLLAAGGSRAAGDPPAVPRDLVTVTLENDLFAGKDGGYTSGVAISWAHGGLGEFTAENMPGWMHALTKDLYISTQSGRRRAVSYTIGQSIQTPSDVTVPTLIEDEAPYVGLLAWSVNLHAFDDRVADRLALTLGMVGPLSGAEAAQMFVHKVTGSDEPKGWDNQIDNEPVFMLSVERLRRLADVSVDGGTGMDLIAIGQAGVGTLQSRLAGGAGIRYGHDLDVSFPTATVLPGRQVNPLAGSASHSWHVFLNVLGAFVANDISIDGNTFQHSHSVPLEHWQAQAVAGLSFNFYRWALLFSATVATDRYEGQAETTRFGSLSVTYNR